MKVGRLELPQLLDFQRSCIVTFVINLPTLFLKFGKDLCVTLYSYIDEKHNVD